MSALSLRICVPLLSIAFAPLAVRSLMAEPSPPRVFFVTEWSGGSGTDALLGPVALALGPTGRIYVAEQSGDRIQVFTRDGRFVTRWGRRWECHCQAGGSDGRFFLPSDVAVDDWGNVYVSDLGHYVNSWPARVQKFTADGAFLSAWEGSAAGRFSYPRGLATDASGNVYVADWGNNLVQVFAGDGGFLEAWSAPQTWSLAVDDARRRVYVDRVVSRSDGSRTYADREIAVFSPAGELTARFTQPDQPARIAVDQEGRVYGTRESSVKVYSPEGELLVEWGSHGSGPGQFGQATGIAVDEQGFVYVADFVNQRIQVFRVEF